VAQQLLRGREPCFTSLDFGLLNSIGLHELVKPFWIAPPTFVRVPIDFTVGGIAHGRILPAGELYDPTGFLCDKQLGGPEGGSRQV